MEIGEILETHREEIVRAWTEQTDGAPHDKTDPERLFETISRVIATEVRTFTHRLSDENRRLLHDLDETITRLQVEQEDRDRILELIVHDLRGPLAAATMLTQHLLRRLAGAPAGEPRDQRDLVARIEKNLIRIDRMIRDLLDANRIRAGAGQPLKLAECDLVAVAREVVEQLTDIVGDRFDLEAPGPVVGFWSAEHLHRALSNLAVNGAKYGAPDGRVRITVRNTDQGVEVPVHNDGLPLTAEEQGAMFQPYRRLKREDGRVGWGLGLTLVRGCAEAHGGSIHVESAEGAGTTFTLFLPRDSRPFQRS